MAEAAFDGNKKANVVTKNSLWFTLKHGDCGHPVLAGKLHEIFIVKMRRSDTQHYVEEQEFKRKFRRVAIRTSAFLSPDAFFIVRCVEFCISFCVLVWSIISSAVGDYAGTAWFLYIQNWQFALQFIYFASTTVLS